MGLEAAFNNIDDLNVVWPLDTDPVEEGDDHLRGIKNALKGNVTGDATRTRLIANGLNAAMILDNEVRLIGGSDPDVTKLTIFDTDNITPRGFVGYGGSTTLQIRNQIVGAPVQLVGEGVGGFNVMGAFNPDGAAILNFAGANRLASTDRGADIFGNITQGQQLNLIAGAAALNAILSLRGTVNGGLRFIWDEVSNEGVVQLTDAAGGNGQTSQRFTPGAGVALNFNGSPALQTEARGGALYGSANFDGDPTLNENQDAQLRLLNFSGDQVARLFYNNGSTGLRLTNDVWGGKVLLTALNPSGVDSTMIDANPGAALTMFFNGVEQLVTTDAAAGTNSGAAVRDAGGLFQPVGFNAIPIDDQSTSRSIATSDNGRKIRVTAASVALTLLAASLPTDGACEIIADSGGPVAINVSGSSIRWLSGSGVVLGNRTLAVGGVAVLTRRAATTEYYLYGSGVS